LIASRFLKSINTKHVIKAIQNNCFPMLQDRPASILPQHKEFIVTNIMALSPYFLHHLKSWKTCPH